MRKLVLFFVILCSMHIGYAQNRNQEMEIVSHTVQLGETVRMLSKKYLVDPADIYKLNKFAVDGIRQGMVLQIPVPRKTPVIQQEETGEQQIAQPETESDSANSQPAKSKSNEVSVINRDSETEHTVEAGETLYSLSRKYGVSVDEIKMSNEGLKGLKTGQVVRIPSTRVIGNEESSIGSTVTPKRMRTDAQAETAATSGEVTHLVAPKETLYSLSKKYGVTVDDIKNMNPDVAQHGLQVGQTLTIRKN